MKNIIWLLLLLLGTVVTLHAQIDCANHALNFDGKDDYIQLNKSPVQGNVNFTIEGWFRSLDNDNLTNCPDGNFERIIGCGGSRLEIGECAGKFSVFIGQGGYINSGMTTGDGKWHYFAITKNGDAFRVFLDGNRVITYDLPVGSTFSLDNNFRIGKWSGGGTTLENWQGDIDEIRIWDAALSEPTLLASRDCQLTGRETGLMAYYNFDQGNPNSANPSVNTLTDLTGLNNTGTLTGFGLSGTLSNWICSGTPQSVLCNDPNRDRPMTRTPANNGVFKIGTSLPNFTWKWNGAAPPPTNYYLEVFFLDGNTSRVVFSRTIDAATLTAATVLGNNPVKGIYQWQVTDPISGQQSPPSFFTLNDASCGTVSSTIKIDCKDWSPNGLPIYTVTLVLTNTATAGTAGCPVKYNSFTPLLGTIGTIAPTLPATITAGTSQVFTFTFTPATLLQTTLVMQCLGNWQDALLNTANFQNNIAIPPCLCNECKEINVLNLIVTPVVGNPSLFNLSGSITATGVPGGLVDAVEFQVKSFRFTAVPYSCTNGITSVETSGGFLNPASTINGSAALVFFNETLSPVGSLTNNNASKDIKWIGGPISGLIPFNLTIGVPTPLPGLNANCCPMKYRICVKATLFYDKKCKVCTTTFCKDFNN